MVSLVFLSLIGVFGCGESTEEKKRRYEQKVAREQAELEKEAAKPDRPALPTADVEGVDFDDVKRPPKSFRLSTDISIKGGKKYGTIEYASTAELDELTSFYRDEMEQAGWSQKGKMDRSMKGLPGALLDYEKGDMYCQIDMEKHITEKNENYYRVAIKQFAKL